MLLNYIRVAIRNIRRSVSYSLINVSGLALGIACGILIFLLVTYHLGFDTFHPDSNRIYRFVTETHRDQVGYSPAVPPAFGRAFREDYTFGESTGRICTLYDVLVTVGEGSESRKFSELLSFAEPAFFDIFNFPTVSGDHRSTLAEPNTALVTEKMALKYFGQSSPVGKTFTVNNKIIFTIKGVLRDLPANTDFRSEIYLSYASMKQYNEWYDSDDSWGGISSNVQTFTRLRPGIDPADVESVLPAYVKKYRAQSKNVHHYKLQPLDDVHFNSLYDGQMSKATILILSVVGFFLIFTACLNFINLATAQAVTRSKEVGIRKVLGSARWQLFWQFTLETAVIVIISTAVALSASLSILPHVNTLFNSRITFDLSSNIEIVGFIALLVVVVTLLAGAYPGLVLSGFRPVTALKGKLTGYHSKGLNLRRSLVITQFTISQILLFGLIVIGYQMRFNHETDMGFRKDGIVMVPAGPDKQRLNSLKNELLAIADVEKVSFCFAAPASLSNWNTSITFDNRGEAEDFAVSFRGADEDFLSTFDIDLVAGRNLMPADTIREFMVNEEFMRRLGITAPEEILGKSILFNGDRTGPVVGVFSNFHDQSFRSAISPVFIATSKDDYHEVAIRISMTNAKETLASIEKVWTDHYPDQLYSYAFVDDQTAAFYEAEEMMLSLARAFAFIALFIGCLGLYGLVSFMSVQKTREIGIRKVLGAGVAQIISIFGKEFAVLTLVSFAIAAPAGAWIMSQWLSLYTFKVGLSPALFLLELGCVMLIVLLTTGIRSLKTALMNPVDALRAE